MHNDLSMQICIIGNSTGSTEFTLTSAVHTYFDRRSVGMFGETCECLFLGRGSGRESQYACYLSETKMKCFVRYSTSVDWGVQVALLAPQVLHFCACTSLAKKSLWIWRKGSKDFDREVEAKSATIYCCTPFFAELALCVVSSPVCRVSSHYDLRATTCLSVRLNRGSSPKFIPLTSLWLSVVPLFVNACTLWIFPLFFSHIWQFELSPGRCYPPCARTHPRMHPHTQQPQCAQFSDFLSNSESQLLYFLVLLFGLAADISGLSCVQFDTRIYNESMWICFQIKILPSSCSLQFLKQNCSAD